MSNQASRAVKVDIIVPTYNRSDILAETLKSVQNQTYSDWICWVAEDGQSEKTKSALEPFLADGRFRHIPGPHAGTPAAPRNRAIKAGSAPLVAFLDDDDIWLPEKLEKQVALMNSRPDCVLVGCNAFVMEGNRDFRREDLPLYFKKAPFGKVPYEKHVKEDYFINSSVVMRRSALKFSGIQNEHLHKGPDGEDYDLWLRVGTLGEMWLMEEPLLVYRDSPSKNSGATKGPKERRAEAYHMKFKVYASALAGVADTPSPLLFPEHDRQYRACLREAMFYALGPRPLGRARHNIWSALANMLYLPPSKRAAKTKAERAFAACRAKRQGRKNGSSVECVVFSKDRALQLHALLSTLREKVRPHVPAHVLYTASSDAHLSAYREIEEIFGKEGVRFVRQRGSDTFRKDLLDILFSMECGLVFFLVDDILFTEDVDLSDLTALDTDRFVPSLRMGRNLSRCYVLQKPQPLPSFVDLDELPEGMVAWRWSEGQLDWGYPLSVDGHIFSRREIASMAALVSFEAPNSLEDALQTFRPWFSNRFGAGYEKSKIVNIPCNRVQSERENLSGGLSPQLLLEKWRNGYRVEYEKIYGFVNESAHQEIPLPLVVRK